MSQILRRTAFAGVLVALTGFAGCKHGTPGSVPTSVPRDSVEGVVAIVGTDMEHRIVLMRADSGIAILTRSSADSASLARVAGLNVRVRGYRSANNSMSVESFLVLRAGQSPVVDGILAEANGQLHLRSTNGITHVLGNPPQQLWQLKSARVWIGGSLATGPNIYGLITPPSP